MARPPAKLARRLNLRLPRIARSRPLTAAGSPRDLPMRRPSRCARAAQAFPEAQRRAIERPQEVHLHLHGVTAEDIAEIPSRQENSTSG